MRTQFGIFLLSLFVYTQVYNTYVWVRYELNKEEITELFCENTDKPEMNCHGVCHLKKEIIDTHTPVPPAENNSFYINEIQLYPNSFEYALVLPSNNFLNHYTPFTDSPSNRLGGDFFHPPRG